jgi:hypothetical protein
MKSLEHAPSWFAGLGLARRTAPLGTLKSPSLDLTL